jgi:hypothetical protein
MTRQRLENSPSSVAPEVRLDDGKYEKEDQHIMSDSKLANINGSVSTTPVAAESKYQPSTNEAKQREVADVQLMSPNHPQWDEFLEELDGPHGCNFHMAVPDDQNSMRWTCDSGDERPLSRRILAEMGLTEMEIEESLSYFSEHGGFCDCEILFNVGGESD